MNGKTLVAALVLCSLLSTGSAMAKPREKDQKDEMGDPNRVICRKIEQIGTRLQTKKVCATAAEWEAMRQRDREMIEQAQQRKWTNAG